MIHEARKVSFAEAKTIIKAKQKKIWIQQPLNYRSEDPLYRLDREEQVTPMRPRTGHSRLRHHTYT